MIEERELLERELDRFAPEPGFVDRIARRRARKRRNQRIAAGVVGVAVFVAAVVAVAGSFVDRSRVPETPPSPTPPVTVEPIGFPGLPPSGSRPSLPKEGTLVLSVEGSPQLDRDPFAVFVYEDGRVIWHDLAPAGATDTATGYLEQRLSPRGIELLRDEILSSGLAGRDRRLGVPSHTRTLWITVLDGERTLSLTTVDTEDEPAPTATDDEVLAVDQLIRRFSDFRALVPASEWTDPEVRPFVASTYEVVFSLVTYQDGKGRSSPLIERFPAPADHILRPVNDQCVTTEEARTIVRAFRRAGIGSVTPESLTFQLPDTFTPHALMPRAMMFFPALPHQADCG